MECDESFWLRRVRKLVRALNQQDSQPHAHEQRPPHAASGQLPPPLPSSPTAQEKVGKTQETPPPPPQTKPPPGSGSPAPQSSSHPPGAQRALPSGDPNGEFPAFPPLPFVSFRSQYHGSLLFLLARRDIGPLGAAPAASPRRPPHWGVSSSASAGAARPRPRAPRRRAVLRPCARAEGGALFSVGWSIWVSVFFLGVIPPITWVSRVSILYSLSRQFGHLQSTISH
jgi:hypothetical protein